MINSIIYNSYRYQYETIIFFPYSFSHNNYIQDTISLIHPLPGCRGNGQLQRC